MDLRIYLHPGVFDFRIEFAYNDASRRQAGPYAACQFDQKDLRRSPRHDRQHHAIRCLASSIELCSLLPAGLIGGAVKATKNSAYLAN